MAKAPRFLVLLLVAALALSSRGVVVVVEGRKVQVMRAVRHYARWRSPLHGAHLQQQQDAAAGMVSTVMDYSDPKPNTNPHSGVIPPPPPAY